MNTAPKIIVPKTAIAKQTEIIGLLKKLVKKGHASCLCREFRQDYTRVLDLFQHYQQEVLAYNGLTVSCKKGCGVCCYHWAEDVYSFEARTIARTLRKLQPSRLRRLLNTLQKDVDTLQNLRNSLCKAAHPAGDCQGKNRIDPYDIALTSFYELKRPCPLLEKNGACGIYVLRPLTCRIYVSFSHPRYCNPQLRTNDQTSTYLLDLENGAMELFDRLHFKYDECDGDTSLRSMLLKLLSRQ